MSKALIEYINSLYADVVVPQMRKEPEGGCIIRIPLPENTFAYAVVVDWHSVWVYDFLTRVPACGAAFFDLERLLFPARLGTFPVAFVNCGKVPGESLNSIRKPLFYHALSDDDRGWLRVDWQFATSHALDAAEVTQSEIIEKKMHLHQWLTWENYKDIISARQSQMTFRDVPEEFIDHEALRKLAAGEPVEEKPLPQPRKVEFLIIFQSADLVSDDPELDLEEPLEEALGDSGCGDVAGSGTAPGVFEINVETISSDRARCLAVIRRVLKKAKAPASTIIKELCEPPVDHPLEAPPPVTKKKPTSKKRR